MCTTCGCGGDGTLIEGHGPLHAHDHVHAEGTVHRHTHDHAHSGSPSGTRSRFRLARPRPSPLESGTETRMITLEADLLAKNDAFARANRARFRDRGILALNLVSSPGSGKTTLLVETIARLQGTRPVAVIEGDQQTTFDADRIRATGCPAIQVNTGKGCHLDAQMVGIAFSKLGLSDGGLLMVENVGNLVCPAGFDLGEAHKVVILSVTEGEDKPLKYPDMFAAADLMILNKIDLLPHVAFDSERCLGYAHRVNSDLQVLTLSATTGEGMDRWMVWLEAESRAVREARDRDNEALRRRIAELESELARRQA